ncbi:MAG: PilZ domain-containing protein [Candidatus Aadella gelida]|nr:PilZ domain-containing protein [Candidatus Aadella gelida]
MYEGAERRKYKRITRPFVARFRILTEDGDGGLFPGWDIVNVQDLSAGGILFNYDDRIAEDSKLEFKLNIPTIDKPVGCVGKVVCAIKEPNSSRVRIASVFTEIDFVTKDEINRFAETT